MSISQTQNASGQQEAGQELQRNLQETIGAALRAAEAARVEAGIAASQSSAAQAQDAPAAEPGGAFTVRVGPDGLMLVQAQPDGTETTTPWDASNIIPPQVADIMLIGVLGVIGMILAFPIGRAVARWIDRRGAVGAVPNDVARRLAAIEDSVQSVAVEIERLSETNRYTARLLTERTAAPDFRAGDARGAQEVPAAQAVHAAQAATDAREPRAATPESASPRSTWQAS